MTRQLVEDEEGVVALCVVFSDTFCLQDWRPALIEMQVSGLAMVGPTQALLAAL